MSEEIALSRAVLAEPPRERVAMVGRPVERACVAT
jgi:hypothetical protein